MCRRAAATILFGLISLAIAGCRGTALPDLFHPRTLEELKKEQRQAERFDPYPENNLGPAVEGVRPRCFDQPWPEPVDARWVYPNGRPKQP